MRFLERAENLRRATQGIRILDFGARIDGLWARATLVLDNAPRLFRMRAHGIADPPSRQ